jgi:hypothetical protein
VATQLFRLAILFIAGWRYIKSRDPFFMWAGFAQLVILFDSPLWRFFGEVGIHPLGPRVPAWQMLFMSFFRSIPAWLLLYGVLRRNAKIKKAEAELGSEN